MNEPQIAPPTLVKVALGIQGGILASGVAVSAWESLIPIIAKSLDRLKNPDVIERVESKFQTVGEGLKNLREMGNSRLWGYMRGNTELSGGLDKAKAVFESLTGRMPVGTFDRVVLKTKEIVFRMQSDKSGLPKIEIVDHLQKFYEKITFK